MGMGNKSTIIIASNEIHFTDMCAFLCVIVWLLASRERYKKYKTHFFLPFCVSYGLSIQLPDVIVVDMWHVERHAS